MENLRIFFALGETPRIAFVGSGGKQLHYSKLPLNTTLPVVVTATSH
ncbi:MAG: hypothetical protein IPP55_20000 [Anaerolineales bacterium]|nr:hypothetical protein [Anaerolineales bacterium]